MGKLMNSLVLNGRVINYGLLSEKSICGIDPYLIISMNVRLEPFYLPQWLRDSNPMRTLSKLLDCIK